jgi:hypothetical protein
MMTEERFHEDESRGHTRMDYAEARKKSHEMQQRIERLLELQTNPEQLTDEQMQQILADDEMRQLVQQLGFAKRAFKHDALKNDTPDVDAEWEKFAAKHAELLDALDEDKTKSHSSFFTLHSSFQKIAASFIGVLLASGIAFATIQVVRNINTHKPQLPSTEQVIDTKPVTSLPADTVKTDTIPTEPYVFNNVPLDSMLTAIAVAHNMQVEFENESARELRFHFVWKREDSLDRVVEKLNTFEAVNIVEEDKTLVVR